VQTIQSRRSRLFFASATALLIGAGGLFSTTVAGRNPGRIDINDFMTGIACVESVGRYEAINKRSGALGKYQFMPRIWRAWSGRYLGNRWAEPTPQNQEFVARERMRDLYQLHQDWRLVAHWWRTGNAPRDESKWTRGSHKYVGRVMRWAQLAASARTRDQVPESCFPREHGRPAVRTGAWPRVVVTGGQVNLRRGAGPRYRAFALARRGDRLAVLGRDRSPGGGLWLKVGLKDGRVGWIYEPLTRPTDRALGSARRGAGN
jgi:hypothetical protein